MSIGDRIKRAIDEERSERTPASGSGGVMAGDSVNQCAVPAEMPGGAYVGDGIMGTAQTPLRFGRGEYRVSQAEQAAKSAAYHREQVELHQDAADSLTAHPEFEIFLSLLRRGAIKVF